MKISFRLNCVINIKYIKLICMCIEVVNSVFIYFVSLVNFFVLVGILIVILYSFIWDGFNSSVRGRKWKFLS